jgi:phage gpG-like protein
MITAYLLGDRELIARLAAAPNGLQRGLARAVTRLGFQLERRVKQKLSGEVLNVRTGLLRASINTRVKETSSEITASVGTNIKYGKFHEYGVPHPWEIRPKSARALAFEVGGAQVFATRVMHPPLPERSFLRSALREMRGQIQAELKQAATAELHR